MAQKQDYLVILYENLVEHFNEDDLRELCFRLGIEYENLPGRTRNSKAIGLVEHCKHRGRVRELVEICAQLRPHVSWSGISNNTVPEPTGRTSKSPTDNLRDENIKEVKIGELRILGCLVRDLAIILGVFSILSSLVISSSLQYSYNPASPKSTPTSAPTPTQTPIPYCDQRGCAGDEMTHEANGIIMEYVYVPSGSFLMGSNPQVRADEIQHQVTLNGFWIGKTEVTSAQFANFLNESIPTRGAEITNWFYAGQTDGTVEQINGGFRPKTDLESHPANYVTWYGADEYCKSVGGRLPTEAEWEYAARGPDNQIYPWGDDFERDRVNLDGVGNVFPELASVDAFSEGASWVGALNMIGNVWEWTNDWYYSYPSTSVTNPTGPEDGIYKVFRGGGIMATPEELRRAASRNYIRPKHNGNPLGFRCVMDVGN